MCIILFCIQDSEVDSVSHGSCRDVLELLMLNYTDFLRCAFP